MGLFSRMKGLFIERKPEIPCPDGVCHNCWRKQAWDKRLIKVADEKQIDVMNKEVNHTFIHDFTAKHLDGISLKSKNGFRYCSECNRRYS